MAIDVCILTVATSVSGLGHLKRSILIASELNARGHSPFLIALSDSIEKLSTVDFNNINYKIVLPTRDSLLEASSLEVVMQSKIIITDFFNLNSEGVLKLSGFFEAISRTRTPKIVFDGIFEKYQNSDINLLIYPYEGEPGLKKVRLSHDKILKGPQFFCQRPEFRELQPTTPDVLNRILITFGGSDPHGFSVEIIKWLVSFEIDIEFVLVLGPLFSDGIIEQCKLSIINSKNRITLLENVPSLASVLQTVDLCICTSGLTKYEAASLGVATLLVHLDKNHQMLNIPFMKLRCSVDCGIGIDPENLHYNIQDLRVNKNKLRYLSANGISHLDGKGIDRIIAKLQELM